MPWAPPKPCAVPGCGKLTHEARCSEHARDYERELRHRYPRKYQGLYGGYWQKQRAAFLAQFPVCRECGKPATVADHVIPHKGNSDRFWDERNLQPLCKRCHDRKTTREGRWGRRAVNGYG